MRRVPCVLPGCCCVCVQEGVCVFPTASRRQRIMGRLSLIKQYKCAFDPSIAPAHTTTCNHTHTHTHTSCCASQHHMPPSMPFTLNGNGPLPLSISPKCAQLTSSLPRCPLLIVPLQLPLHLLAALRSGRCAAGRRQWQRQQRCAQRRRQQQRRCAGCHTVCCAPYTPVRCTRHTQAHAAAGAAPHHADASHWRLPALPVLPECEAAAWAA
jgi:hypothetical protein